MGSKVDLRGQRFGRLTVIREDASRRNGSVMWLCRCDCGNEVLVRSNHLKRGGVMSCGCYNHDIIRTHDESKTNLYHTLQCMKDRCSNPKNVQYADYGGRGIKVCDEWLHDYEAFRDWALANGYRKGLSIDRINNDGDYEPSNCRWTDMKTQCRNRRSNRMLTINGETHCLIEWAEIVGINASSINTRLRRGWSAYDAVFRPIG